MNEMTRTSFSDMGHPDSIDFAIDAAKAAAEAGALDEAVRWFDLCRTLLTTSAPAVKLKLRLDANMQSIAEEAERCHEALLKRSATHDATTRMVIIGDSLALPRPEEMESFPACLDQAYPGIVLNRLQVPEENKKASVWAHCQRYFTTNDAVELLQANSDVLADAHVLLHLGLNDAALRMFMENQRLAIALLPPPISDKILAFSRQYRREIINAFPGFCYVPVAQYRANLHRIASIAYDAGAASLTFTTVIVVPWKFWPATPGVCHNFTTYNLAIMDVAAEVGANVLDVDRLMWQNNVARTLNKDGMHLSPVGHELLADAWIKQVLA
ncbi:GDSL-type esterase/lipase family protein [Ciceribacter sp. RN22]|uniref:SGNH/GDSL hydrolase family protein n=1 Tax=Ciceribacter sp. RN22 TaxID=2954932 RepID=UPI002093CC79|nr:GDSL-type esterase/lipase family protein [Ciceribacter sp. RN22]MCO6179006.1 GDSL-type esterase/lipase family protein [Ciceribacter sp. RN22]